ncbi:exodeoxyribonuclease VII large subunit [Luteolibacter pohnpeiensis]|uniref:Exodeoxyribonuclease 7 large subunit n=1 Tax=Luteolibacter pohnpeiensis TaxID=454153 RepID=A0A934S8Y4_9BACT|nr:exodeoxyribonuclease VII large subunit [Luteolibacter pohnpeiensis]MBK1884342.1 exodeoxyribonuclease VII large subunit [Luteolibacter pohnpeiensis]
MDLFSRSAGDGSRKPDGAKAVSVTQLLRRMRNLLEVQIGELWIEGEVSNLKKQGSGHWYFSLKDEGAQIQCAMFSARRREGAQALEDGAKVQVFAEASVYEARGQLQVIVQKVERAGAGDLQARFEALKRKLQAEGLFDAARKKPIPAFPQVVGIVTSETGAAIRDILNVLQRRAPWVQPVLLPVRVQGRGVEREIAHAINQLGRAQDFGFPVCDVLIVGRGGGSLEDLWCFNEEIVARAIAACPVPVISAVGHEIDFTIADFVADLRAPTPSAAAELAVPDGVELLAKLQQSRRRMMRRVAERLEQSAAVIEGLRRGALRKDGERLLREPVMRLDHLRGRLETAARVGIEASAGKLAEVKTQHAAMHPARVVERRLEQMQVLRERLQRSGVEALDRQAERMAGLRGLLRTLGPESAFQRGFSITLDPAGRVLRSVHALKNGELIRTKLADGEIQSRIEAGE